MSTTHALGDHSPMTPTVSALPTQRLTCHASHPDPRRRARGEACGTILGRAPGYFQFVTATDQLPDLTRSGEPGHEHDVDFWLRCSRSACGKWNRFRIVPPPAAVEEPKPAA